MALTKLGGQKVEFGPLWRTDKLFLGNNDNDREVNHASIKKALTITR